jgi:hypothetical protein
MEWCAPKELPDLRRVGIIALDTETRDDRLRSNLGSGWPFRQGHICGVSVAYRADDDIRAHYFPLRHPDSENLDPEQVYQWVRDHIAAGVRFTTQNGLYDWGWLRAEAGIRMPEQIEEIGALATMVVQVQPRRAVRLAWIAGQGRHAAAPGDRGIRSDREQAQEGRASTARLAITGALCRALCRGGRRQHAAPVRKPRSHS